MRNIDILFFIFLGYYLQKRIDMLFLYHVILIKKSNKNIEIKFKYSQSKNSDKLYEKMLAKRFR